MIKKIMNRFNLVSASLNPVLFALYRQYLYWRYNDSESLSQAELIHEKSKKHLLSMSNSFKNHFDYFQSDKSNSIKLNSYQFPNPIGLASGFDKNCDLFRFHSHFMEYLICQNDVKHKELLSMNATQRYLSLRKQIPNIDNLIPQYQIASYLSITPVQLSRIRAKL